MGIHQLGLYRVFPPSCIQVCQLSRGLHQNLINLIYNTSVGEFSDIRISASLYLLWVLVQLDSQPPLTMNRSLSSALVQQQQYLPLRFLSGMRAMLVATLVDSLTQCSPLLADLASFSWYCSA